jgi:GNAT superfamily N-acetyltransferase
VEIRRARHNEWRELRALRLRALAEDPDAFARTLAEEQDLPEERWEEAARGVIFVAVDGDQWVGMAAVHATDMGAAAEIWGMWVRAGSQAPGGRLVATRRRRGVGPN